MGRSLKTTSYTGKNEEIFQCVCSNCTSLELGLDFSNDCYMTFIQKKHFGTQLNEMDNKLDVLERFRGHILTDLNTMKNRETSYNCLSFNNKNEGGLPLHWRISFRFQVFISKILKN